jgi:glutathione S-transferase
MIVHGATPSPFYRKVIVALEEKGLAYETKNTTPFPKTPELIERHPLGKIPFLEVDGAFIPDSSVICAYLERTHPDKPLLPADAKHFAHALFLEEYADSKMGDVIGGVFFERFVKPNVFQQETDEARVAEIIANDLPPVLDYLEKQLAGKEWLAGDFSVADAAVGNQLASLQFAQTEIDAARWPGVAAYQKRVLARPSFQKAMTFA